MSLNDVLNGTLIEMLIVMSTEDQLTVSIDAQPGMPLVYVHHSFFVQSLLTFAKAINTLRKLQKILKQSATPRDYKCEVKANLENQPKEQHNAGNYHYHCTLHPEASHHYNQQYLHMISCILRYLYEN